MRLSMWILANRLEYLEPELHLSGQGPQTLLSARLRYAQDCVYVYDDGPNAVCRHEEEYFVLRDMGALQALDIVQSVFDFFNDLEERFLEAERRMDLQSILDDSWFFLHNPLLLQDANHMVLAMSQQYEDDEVSDEWRFCADHGYISIATIRQMRRFGPARAYYLGDDVQYHHFPGKAFLPVLTNLIVQDNIRYGRISVYEYSRPLNYGDVQVLRYITSIFRRMLPRLCFLRGRPWTCNLFAALLQGAAPGRRQLELQYAYYGWPPGERFRLAVCRPGGDDAVRWLRERFPAAHVMPYREEVVALLPDGAANEAAACEALSGLCRERGAAAGLSLPFAELDDLRSYHGQARLAMEAAGPGGVGRFASLAWGYLLREDRLERQLCACHPFVAELFRENTPESGQALETLAAYLAADCSISQGARLLGVHRNTFQYRAAKVLARLEAAGGDAEDPDDRDYLLLSCRVAELARRELSRESDR